MADILTDATFVEYGGHTGTSTAAQRGIAYDIAEGQATTYLGTPLVVTSVTGTFPWPIPGSRFRLPHDRLAGVTSVTAVHEAGCQCASTVIEMVGCAWVHDFDAAIIELRETSTTASGGCSCACGHGASGAVQARVVYQAGLPAAAATDASLLMGLVTLADLVLEQIIDPAGAEGGPGNVGVQSYGAGGYNETRVPLKRNVLGSSARSQWAGHMLDRWKLKTGLQLGGW